MDKGGNSVGLTLGVDSQFCKHGPSPMAVAKQSSKAHAIGALAVIHRKIIARRGGIVHLRGGQCATRSLRSWRLAAHSAQGPLPVRLVGPNGLDHQLQALSVLPAMHLRAVDHIDAIAIVKA